MNGNHGISQKQWESIDYILYACYSKRHVLVLLKLIMSNNL